MVDIFISYSSMDRLRVLPLAEALKACGWRVWWDQDMRTGQPIEKTVNEYLKSARVVIGVLSCNTSESGWFFGETEEARKRNVLFPVLLDDIELPIRLAGLQATQLFRWSGRSESPQFQRLIDHIAEKLPNTSAPKAPEATPRVFNNPLREFKRKEGKAAATDDGGAPRTEETKPGPAKSEPTDSFDDPTIEFPRTAASKPYRFSLDSLQEWSKRLRFERLIGVRSPNDEITSAAVDALLQLEDLKDYDLRLLAFDASNQERTDIFLENLIQRGVGKPNRATIVIVDPHGALPFIESILCGPHKAKAIAMELGWRDILFIVQIGSRYQRELKPRFDEFHFGCWNVDWLGPMLTRIFSSDAPALLKRLKEQRDKGYWGEPHDDLAFHELLQGVLATGKEGLAQALERHESTSLEQLRPQPALQAFRSGTPYHRGIVLCAAFFPGLDVTEFKKLCLSIVGDAKVFVPDSVSDASGSVQATSRMSTLKDEWVDVADEILEKCGLTVGKTSGKRSVTFAYPEERASLVSFIDGQANFFCDSARKLWAMGFFFGRDSSPELVDGMIALFVATLDHDAAQKQPQWLSNELALQLSWGRAESISEFLQKAALDSFVLSRTSLLLRALLAIQEHAPLVMTWLADLLSRGGHLQALRLATHLRYTDGFDYLYWLKRFCDESPEHVRVESYLALYQHARQSSAQIWEFLSELKSWLPARSKSLAELSRSNEDALRLIIEYSFDAEKDVRPQDIGKWPSRYPLFRDMTLDWKYATECLELLLSWLFHPALPVLFDGDSIAAAWEARGQMILLWSNVLLGLEDERTHPAGGEAKVVDLIDPQARVTYHRILTLCWQNTDQAGRVRLCEVWRAQKERARSEREEREREDFAYLTKWIRLIENLETDFRAVAAEQRKSPNDVQAGWWNTAHIT